ncbi:HAD family hydrolase [Microseira wollei]|uniref:Haloacid dehalogenase-like hydrolase n=1 Tax=Microseira wollei NIES-4236 TaxID=2530354 RepID=A0AAV3XGW7_9CYAN|nr:HAD family hydrolase [Microseira wollei]GET40185.1 haloacid dehalogenase-like hydrolase [Microseira wollei NIES-4236]
MLRVITDFDGPIVDVSERYYRVYQFCLEKTSRQDRSVRQLSKDEFWQLKRARVPEWEIGMISGLDPEQAQEFATMRRQTVHTLPYFHYDELIPGAVDALEKVQQAGVDLVVMTMRREIELDYALERFDLGRFFPPNRRYRLSNDYVKTQDIDEKPLLMQQALKELPLAEDTWMVGDTEADIVAAKTNGVRAIAVLSGIRDRVELEAYLPDWIVNDLSAAVDLILSQCPQKISA